jgi:membrane protease YdiL (CAAX protease family)
MTFGTLRHPRRRVAAAGVAGIGLLGLSLSTEPDSMEFYALTLGVASVWTLGGLSSGAMHFRPQSENSVGLGPVVVPVLVGAGAFAAFYGGALVARRVPALNEAITSILKYAHQGSTRLVMLTALANGAAEEVFFRGALYTAAGTDNPIMVSTAGYVLATTATRNPALVLASAVMGTLFAWERRISGGVQAPMLTHLTWSALMVRYLPPLFRRAPPECG